MIFDGYEIILAEGDLIGGRAETVTGGGENAAQPNTQATATETGAQAPAGTEQESNPFAWVTWVVIYGGLFFALWFFMFRPQRKKAKEQKRMLEELKSGENVMTTSGFFGKIVSVGADSFLVEFGEGRGVRVWVRKSEIAGVREPVMTPPPEN